MAELSGFEEISKQVIGANPVGHKACLSVYPKNIVMLAKEIAKEMDGKDEA